MLKEKFKDAMVMLGTVPKETIDRHFALSVEQNDEFFELLVEMGADVNANYGRALAMAVKANDLVRMKLLLEHGANPALFRKCALKLAIETANLEALKLMYEYRQNMKDDEKELGCSEVEKIAWCDSSLYYSSLNGLAIRSNNLEIVRFLLPEITNQGKETRKSNLSYALDTKNFEMIKLVYEPQKIDGKLMRDALFTNSLQIIQFMMGFCEGKLPEDTIDVTDGAVTMRGLARYGCCEAIKYLVEMPSETRGTTYQWEWQLDEALKAAVENGQMEVMKFLVQCATVRKIKVNKMFSCDQKNADPYVIVKTLIDYQMIPDYTDIVKEAAGLGRIDILKLLRKNGKIDDYKKALEAAVENKQEETVLYLLKKGKIVLTPEEVIKLLELRWRIDFCKNGADYNVTQMLMVSEYKSSKK